MSLSLGLPHSPRKAPCRVLAALVMVSAFVLAPFTAPVVHAQAKDPGPRAGAAGAGGFYPTLNANEQQFFNQALARFQEVDSVSGTIANENGVGLGPTFNGNSCAQCHAQPNIAQQLSLGNVIFRIPTPVFGLGLVENTPDASLQSNLSATQNTRNQYGIGGSFNTSGNDGSIT